MAETRLPGQTGATAIVMLDILLEQNPQKKAQLVDLGKNEGARRTLAHLLTRKLSRGLT